MSDIDWSGLALAITAIGGVIIGIIQALKIATKVEAIDNAVNNKLPGAQTIGEEVSDLHGDRPNA
jgi:hypothetical protein